MSGRGYRKFRNDRAAAEIRIGVRELTVIADELVLRLSATCEHSHLAYFFRCLHDRGGIADTAVSTLA